MIQPTLRIGLVQTDLVWTDVRANLLALEKQLDGVTEEVDLFVLPEMFSTGFCMKPDEVDPNVGNLSFEWLVDQARVRKTGFCGSILYQVGEGKYVNRMFLVEPNGSFTHYDKRHRFAMAGEDSAYEEGSSKPVIASFRGWRILLQVCYDLRFPVFSRNSPNGYDAVVYVANWPKPRRLHWRTLLTARAIENQAFCLGVNRIGLDDNKLDYVGDSMAIDPLGELIVDARAERAILIAQLDLSKLKEVRSRLPFLSDADEFKLLD